MHGASRCVFQHVVCQQPLRNGLFNGGHQLTSSGSFGQQMIASAFHQQIAIFVLLALTKKRVGQAIEVTKEQRAAFLCVLHTRSIAARAGYHETLWAQAPLQRIVLVDANRPIAAQSVNASGIQILQKILTRLRKGAFRQSFRTLGTIAFARCGARGGGIEFHEHRPFQNAHAARR